MTRLVWGDNGSRLYEIGVDRGVVYHDEYPGEPWTGIMSVSEKNGTTITPHYLDGMKVFQISTLPEFAADVVSISEPDLLRRCVGESEISNGLILTNQRVQMFDFTYRTLVGNDLEGVDHGYKIHLVYNAMSGPPDRNYVSIADNPNVLQKTWSVQTVPERITGAVPTAHVILDSRKIDQSMMLQIEAYLYGSETSDPQMLTPDDLILILTPEEDDG